MRRGWVGAAAVLVAASCLSIVAQEAPAGAVKGGVAVTDAHRYPYMAYMFFTGAPASYCSGTLITPSWILTAGHCVTKALANPGQEQVWLGLVKPGLVPTAPPLHIDAAYQQPGWAHHVESYVNDVGLMHLTKPVPAVPTVQLARLDDARSWDPCGRTRTGWGCLQKDVNVHPPRPTKVLGFGVTCATPLTCATSEGQLREASLNVLGYAQIRAAYPNPPYRDDVHSAAMVLGAGVANGSADSCGGDSGGPLLSRMSDGAWREIALVSWATGGCGASPPNGVNMQLGIGPARSWIESLVPALSRISDAQNKPDVFYTTVDAKKPGHLLDYGFAGPAGTHSLGSKPISVCRSCAGSEYKAAVGYHHGIELYLYDHNTGHYCFSSDPKHAQVDYLGLRFGIAAWQIHWDDACGQTFTDADYTDLVTTVWTRH